MGIRDPYVAYCFDEAIAFRVLLEQAEALQKPGPQGSMTISGGSVMAGSFGGVIGQY